MQPKFLPQKTLGESMKKLTCFLAVILSFVISVSGINPAFAQDDNPGYFPPGPEYSTIYLPQPESLGITKFYTTQANQTKEAKFDQDTLNEIVVIPNLDYVELLRFLPSLPSDFPAYYQKILVENHKKNGVNGSFTEGIFDFTESKAVVPGTNRPINLNAPLDGRIYSVVAGKPASECPLNIKESAVAFFDNEDDASNKAKDLDKQGYLVYVSPVDDLTIKAFSQIFYEGQGLGPLKDTNAKCLSVSGATEQVTVDFTHVFSLLTDQNLQQTAKQGPFEYSPLGGDYIYFVEATKALTVQGGNPALDGEYTRGPLNNYYLVDTNNPINVDGQLNTWQIVLSENSYFFDSAQPVQLMIYRKSSTGCWSVVGQSDIKTPPRSEKEEILTFTLPNPIDVKAGDFVGLHFPKITNVAYSVTDIAQYNKNRALNNLTGKVLYTDSNGNPTEFTTSANFTYSVNVSSR
ncbi:MAG: hypothetical protein AB4062_03535 [Crocosphaera sp.]